ncbi:MAG: PIN domain-containing protein [Candidatus Woesearchaeota archaeon]|nr:PIN domain-containing protein [Candidatus Woesearchaeota archaeon]
MTEFFADTYALIEILKGTASYASYADKHIVTSKLCIMELYYYFLRTRDEQAAEHCITTFSLAVTPISFTALRAGMQFKYMHKKQKLSYTDCVGYATAVELGVPFLTGDNQFQHMPNVAFVK